MNTSAGASIWSETRIPGGQVIQLLEKKKGSKYFDKNCVETEVKQDGYLFQGEIGGTAELNAILTNKELMSKLDA